jgi:hypothetical protein
MAEIECHPRLGAEFADFLKSAGYLDLALLFEPSIRDADRYIYRPDFLIVGPVNNERLAGSNRSQRAPT